jgi:hypothetical protein
MYLDYYINFYFVLVAYVYVVVGSEFLPRETK